VTEVYGLVAGGLLTCFGAIKLWATAREFMR
jgi:hypothetical protein